MFYGIHFHWWPLPLERCQRWLLHPLRTRSLSICRCNRIWSFTFPIRAGFQASPSLTPVSPHPSVSCYLFILWCYSDLKWNAEKIWRLWRRWKENFLAGWELSSQRQPSADVVSSQRPLGPPSNTMQFIFIQGHLITWYFFAHSFVCVNCDSRDFVSPT